MSTLADVREEAPFFPAARCPYGAPTEHVAFRDAGGLHPVTIWDGSRVWLATRHADVRAVLGDPRFSADVRNPGFPNVSADFVAKWGGSFIRLDDPEHARVRQLLISEFTLRRTNALRPDIEAIADRLIDDMIAAGQPCDLVTLFARPVPTRTICLLLGVDYDESPTFQRFTEISLDLAAPLDVKVASQQEAVLFYERLVAEKRENPGDDLISRLLADDARSGALQGIDLAKLVHLLVSAGHETTANQISLGTLSILLDDTLPARVAHDPAAAAFAVEELLRFWAIVDANPRRVALADAEVGEQLVRKGEGVILSLVSANRDPLVFGTDGRDAEEVNLDREHARRHLSFGFGIHQCLGQNLARLEMQIAWQRLFTRLPTLRLAVSRDEVAFKRDAHVFGLDSLLVSW